MANVSKIFRKENPERTLDSEIEVSVDYNEAENSISDLRVTAYNYCSCKIVDITPVFDGFPEFITIIDNIDWREVYREHLASKRKKEVLNEA